MNNLTPEQIEQNAAAYVASMSGKPWQWYSHAKKQWRDDIAKDRSVFWHTESGYLCRPTPAPEPPKPWDCPEDVPGPVCWLRMDASITEWMVLAIHEDGVAVSTIGFGRATWDELRKQAASYSTDRKTWKPCVKEVK